MVASSGNGSTTAARVTLCWMIPAASAPVSHSGSNQPCSADSGSSAQSPLLGHP